MFSVPGVRRTPLCEFAQPYKSGSRIHVPFFGVMKGGIFLRKMPLGSVLSGTAILEPL